MTRTLAGAVAVLATLTLLPIGATGADTEPPAPEPIAPDPEKAPVMREYDEKCKKQCAPQYTALQQAEARKNQAEAFEAETKKAAEEAEARVRDAEGKIKAKRAALDATRVRMNDKSQTLKARQQAGAEAKAQLAELESLQAQEAKLTEAMKTAWAERNRAEARSREASSNYYQKHTEYFDCLKKCKAESGKPTALLIGGAGGGAVVVVLAATALSGGGSPDADKSTSTTPTTATTPTPAPTSPTCAAATGSTTATLAQDQCGGFGGFVAPASLTCISNRATIEFGDRIPRRYTGDFGQVLNLVGMGPFGVPGVSGYEGMFSGSTTGNTTTGVETFTLVGTNGARCTVGFNHSIQWNR